MASEVAAKIGIKIVDVAVLEVTSVRNVSMKLVIIIITMSGTLENKVRLLPIHAASPVVLKPAGV